MRIVLLIAALAAALLAAFVLLNWGALAAPEAISLGLASVELPIGLTVLVLSAVVVAALTTYIVAQSLFTARARHVHARAIDAQRSLAEKAEASRFNELRTAMKAEFERLSSTLTTTQDALRVEIQDSGNSIAAMLAEIDDRAKPPFLPADGPN